MFSKGVFSDLVSAAELLGLEPARERHKYACPVHGGSDSLHAYQGAGSGFYCGASCGDRTIAGGINRRSTRDVQRPRGLLGKRH